MSAPLEFLTPTEKSCVETEVKKSKFITVVAPVNSKEEFQALYRNIQAQFPNANHHCYAYVIGPPDSRETGSSDDGEPSGTAGMPILTLLQHKNLGNTAVIVTRIFGGVKLGTGGLVRAYSNATKAGIEKAVLKKQVQSHRIRAVFPFRFENGVRYLLSSLEISITEAVYTESVIFELDAPANLLKDIESRLKDLTGGTCEIEQVKPEE